MSVVSMVCGASTADGATFVAKVDGGGPVRVAVADNAAMAGAVFTASQVVDAQGVAKVSIAGLAAGSRWFWQVEDAGVLDTTLTGRFRTHPPLGVPGSFSWAIASCAGSNPAVPGVGAVLAADRLSNHPVFLDIIARDPLGFSHDGDLGYYDLGNGVVGDGSLTSYRRFYDDVLLQPNQHQLYREVAWQYVWDNHDWGRDLTDESDGTLPDAANAQTVYRERVPHYPLTDPAGIWQAWQVARVQFVALDTRSFRSPNADPDGPAKTMLGAGQKAWLQGVLESSTAEWLVLISSSVWHQPELGVGSDTWESFPTERQELINLFASTGWLSRMVVVWGDRHAMGIDAGSNMPGGMPGAQFAPLDDSTPSGGADWFDTGDEGSVPGQYGVLTFTDLGTTLVVEIAGWQGPDLWRTHRIGLTISSPPPPPGALLRTLTGAHRATFEARVLTSFQTGPDPDGEIIQFTDGQVRMDGTADVQRALALTVAEQQFPHRLGDALLPAGNELFIRRGVDIGSDILWTPLGYFRIEDGDQDDDGPIRITGYDRMKAIVDSELLEPLRFDPDATYGAVFTALVNGVYPDAVVVFDDDLGTELIGRPLDVEHSRIEPLRTLAHGRGKIVHWDGEGLLQVRTAPDPAIPVWEANAGRAGVLSAAKRRITRQDVRNAAVVRSQGGDELAPARAVAIDDGPSSMTRFGGPFGVVPVFLSTPAETSTVQAAEAARQTLLRRAGLPYQVEFTAVPNPTLTPYDPVRVTHKTGEIEKHVLERLAIPLTSAGLMTAGTREQRLSRVIVRDQ